MKSKSLQRLLLLTSGICAVLVILLSQSFYQSPTTGAKEKTGKSTKKEVAIHAPSDVAAQGQGMEISHSQPPAVEKIVLDDHKNVKAVFVQQVVTNFFKTLFRAIISPNAP
jgi:hypothetical protein